MARLCDDIERFILEEMRQRGQVELQRCDLAARFSCAPSQINYVLSTRFTAPRGYRVETRRGGGGFVRVFRIDQTRVQYMQGLCEQLPRMLSEQQAADVLSALCKSGIITLPQARLMLSAVGEDVIGSDESAGRMRAGILNRMLLCAAKEE